MAARADATSMLRARLFTAAIAIAVLLAVLFLAPPIAAQVAVALTVLAGAWEWTAFARLEQPLQRAAYLALVALLVLALWRSVHPGDGLEWLLGLSLAWWLLAAVWIVRYPMSIRPQVVALAGLLVLVPVWLVLLAVLTAPGIGASLLLWLLLIVWAADVGAYVAGRRFGRARLAPRVSPGKTWEGAAGGVAAAALVAAIGGLLLLDAPPLAAAALGVAMAIVSIVGDLTVSMFKRNAGLKDSGWLFPGHGGVLDRIDSLSAAAPLFLLGVMWLGIGP